MAEHKSLLWILVAYAVAVGVVFILSSDWLARQTWAVVFTGAAVIWYTWEAKRLRDSSERNVELQSRPFVILTRAPQHFLLTNIGAGPALNVSIDDVMVDKEMNAFIRFRDIVPVVGLDEPIQIFGESFVRGESQGNFLDAHFDAQYANRALYVTVRYQDADLRRYAVKLRTSPGKFTIAGFEGAA